MAITARVYQIHLAATPDRVWAAITDSEWTRRCFHEAAYATPPVAGAAYRIVLPDGRDAIDGMVEQMVPPHEGRPGRFVVTWHVLYDAALAAEPPGRVEWTVEAVGEGLTRVRVVHGDLASSPLTWARAEDGWGWILDAMKTLLETGAPLPPVGDPGRAGTGAATGINAPVTAGAVDAGWHRRQGVAANNEVFALLEQPAAPERDEAALRHAYAAAYHWERAAGAGPANQARAAYMVSKVLLATGQAARALVSADQCRSWCVGHGLADFDLAYAHEARARALAALGRDAESAQAWREALAVPIADPEDRALVEQDFADSPG